MNKDNQETYENWLITDKIKQLWQTIIADEYLIVKSSGNNGERIFIPKDHIVTIRAKPKIRALNSKEVEFTIRTTANTTITWNHLFG